MARPISKRQQGKPKSKKRKAEEEAFLDEGDEMRDEFFDASDDDQAASSEDEEAKETAEEKRLRLAKAYLNELQGDRRETGAEDYDTDDSEDARGVTRTLTHEELAERLQKQAMESAGHLQRRLAHLVDLPDLPEIAEYQPGTFGKHIRCHRSSVTAVALANDDRTCFSVAKDGSICKLDVETMQRTQLELPASSGQHEGGSRTAEWMGRTAQRGGGRSSLLAAAVSSDGRYLAVGGGDRKVHVWDARTGQHVQAFPGHKDIISGVAFREGTHELFSASFDRSVKLWSVDDKSYVDSLFGHQSEVLSIDVLRQERAVTSGYDHTCRVWKIPDESQLVYRGYTMAIDCCRYITGTEWLTGSADGSLAVWSQLKKKPISVVRNAHAFPAFPAPREEAQQPAPAPRGAGSVGGDAARWIQSVAVCRGADVVASGAGDGAIRLWSVQEGKSGGARQLAPLGALPARGFVNGLALARSGRFLVAGLGQEPRLGRWSRDAKARNGLLVCPIALRGE